MTRKEFLKKLDAEQERVKECEKDFYFGFLSAVCIVKSLLPEQFEEEPSEFDWGNVHTGEIVRHKELGYGIVRASAFNIDKARAKDRLGAEIRFESGVSKLFFGDQYREFTKIVAWTADIQA